MRGRRRATLGIAHGANLGGGGPRRCHHVALLEHLAGDQVSPSTRMSIAPDSPPLRRGGRAPGVLSRTMLGSPLRGPWAVDAPPPLAARPPPRGPKSSPSGSSAPYASARASIGPRLSGRRPTSPRGPSSSDQKYVHCRGSKTPPSILHCAAPGAKRRIETPQTVARPGALHLRVGAFGRNVTGAARVHAPLEAPMS